MTAGIFGAGQAGLMVRAWLPASIDVKCFFDNDKTKHGVQKVDTVIIAVLNRDAAYSIRRQIEASGFCGDVLDVNDVRRVQDIRLAGLRLIAGQITERNIPGAVAELGVYREILRRKSTGFYLTEKFTCSTHSRALMFVILMTTRIK